MDRERIDGGPKKTTGTIKEETGRMIGSRHLDQEGGDEEAEARRRSDAGKAMDAIREVVHNQK